MSSYLYHKYPNLISDFPFTIILQLYFKFVCTNLIVVKLSAVYARIKIYRKILSIIQTT